MTNGEDAAAARRRATITNCRELESRIGTGESAFVQGRFVGIAIGRRQWLQATSPARWAGKSTFLDSPRLVLFGWFFSSVPNVVAQDHILRSFARLDTLQISIADSG